MPISGIVRGLGVTLGRALRTFGGRNFFRGPGLFTVQYPEERLVMPPRFRGALMQLTSPETGQLRCTACGLCVRACPVVCLELETVGQGRERKLAAYRYDLGECMFCGLCVQACNFQALYMSPEFELAMYKHATIWHLDKLVELGKKYAPDGVPPSEREG